MITIMNGSLHRAYEENQQWVNSLLVMPASVIVWLLFGVLFSASYFDTTFFDNVKVINKSDTLSYLSVLLAIQIPLFILFLERMSGTGHIFRRTLPQATNFREILTAMVILSSLVLLSPRAAFLYAPIALLILVNLFAIYRAATVIFQPEKLEAKNKKVLRKKVHSSFELMLNRRKGTNDFYEKLKKQNYVDYSILEPDIPVDIAKLEVRSPKSGYLEEIDLENLSKIASKEFQQADQASTTDKQAYMHIGIKLRRLPATVIKKHTTLAMIYLPTDGNNDPEKFRRQVLNTFRIVKSSGANIQWVDDLISEFEEQLNKAIAQKDTLLLTQTFELMQILLDQVDEFIDSKREPGYNLDSAFKELSQFIGDEFSKRIDHLFEILSDLIPKALREDQVDINREIVRFIYVNLLDASHTENITSIARYDRLLTYGLSQFIYSNAWNNELTASQIETRDDYILRIKEHTDLLVYELRKARKSTEDSITAQWFTKRLDTLRGFCMAAYKNHKQDIFSELFDVLAKSTGDKYYDPIDENLELLVRCNIFMLASYIFYRGDLDNDYGKRVSSVISKWQEDELTRVFIECAEKKYADKWRVDTYDHAADGVVRMVPDYSRVHKELWVKLMLEHPRIIDNVSYYGDRSMFEKTLLFTNGLDKDTENPILDILKQSKSPNASDLLRLVESFIQIRRDWENSTLTNEKLDKAKVDEFSHKVIEGYQKSSVVQKIFSANVASSRTKKGYIRTGINQLFDKQGFIKDWHIGYASDYFGSSIGEDIATNQDRYIFSRLLKKNEEVNSSKEFVNLLKKNKRVEWIIIANGVGSWEIRRELEDYIDSKSSSDDLYLKGIVQTLSIKTIYTDDIPQGLYAVDASKLGKLTVKPTNFEPPVNVDVRAYSHSKELMQEIIQQAPEWLSEKGPRREQEKFLNTKVRLFVERIFKYAPPRSPKIIFFRISDDIV